MFILARGGQSYARLRFNVGPGSEQTMPVSVDYSRPFAAASWDDWRAEYAANVSAIEPLLGRLSARAERMARDEKAELAASNGLEERQLAFGENIRFVRAAVLGGVARSNRQVESDPFYDPERLNALDDEEFLRQGYFYDE
jgi:hypothetical protein